MKVVLFDLGNTLEDDRDVLLPGARETLKAIQAMKDAKEQPPVLALISDFDMPSSPAEIPAIRERYVKILNRLRIRPFFEPILKKVTLSTEVGVFKPDKKIFQAAINKIDSRLGFKDVVFITENLDHVQKARLLRMKAIHFKGPGQTSGDVNKLVDLIPLIKTFVQTPVT